MFFGAIDPVAFELGFLTVNWYGLILGLAAVAGFLLALYEAKRIGLNTDIVMDLVIYAVPAAIIGARVYYVIFLWELYSANPIEIIAVWHGGLAIHGALIGSVVAGLIYAKLKGIAFFKLADLAAPSILLGQAIGRWGNFINQEAHGGPVDLEFLQNLHLPQFIIDQMYIQGEYYHPTFLYESIWNLAGVILLLLLRRKNPLRGMVFFSYFIWYSIGRFYIEGLRTDSLSFNGPDWLASFMNILWAPMNLLFEPGSLEGGNIRMAQFIGVVMIIISIIIMLYKKYSSYPVKYQE